MRIRSTWLNRKYEIDKRRQAFHRWVAYAVPGWLVYWCAIRLGVNATTGEHRNQVVPDLAFMDALERWGDKP